VLNCVVPFDTIPNQVGQLAAHQYGWDEQTNVTSQRCVKGRVGGYDSARRGLTDEIHALLRDLPTTPD